MDAAVLGYYATPGRSSRFDEAIVSRDVRHVVAVVQGLLVYDTAAADFYGVELGPEQADAIHERDPARVLELARRLDSRPLEQARPPGRRVGARCDAYSRLTVALLRAAGVPARARCGFASYFVPGWFEDHWVAEFWNADDDRWQVVDAQLDATWRERIGFEGDPFSIAPSEFVPAGTAWQAWRRGDLDADRCGLTSIREHGPHWIAGNLRLDLAALNKVEMLPWDIWGARWEPDAEPGADLLACVDAAAALTGEPDDRFDELRRLYMHDARWRMEGTVFNAERGRFETV